MIRPSEKVHRWKGRKPLSRRKGRNRENLAKEKKTLVLRCYVQLENLTEWNRLLFSSSTLKEIWLESLGTVNQMK
jgi:hypothetical protein